LAREDDDSLLINVVCGSIVVLREVVGIATNRAGCGSGIVKLEGVVARLTITDQKITSSLSWLVVMACGWVIVGSTGFSQGLAWPAQLRHVTSSNF
jgi:hypothetical protein